MQIWQSNLTQPNIECSTDVIKADSSQKEEPLEGFGLNHVNEIV